MTPCLYHQVSFNFFNFNLNFSSGISFQAFEKEKDLEKNKEQFGAFLSLGLLNSQFLILII